LLRALGLCIDDQNSGGHDKPDARDWALKWCSK